jgi:nucleoside-diphosphate-sugar epimerase
MSVSSSVIANQPRALIIGCGDVGMRLLPILVKTHKVYVLTTQDSKKSLLRSMGAVPLVGNLDQWQTLKKIAHLAPYVIHLAPPNQEGPKDLRTRNLLRALSQGGETQRLIYVSTSGVYGDCKGDFVSETRTLAPTNPRGQRRMDAEQQLRAWAIHHRVQVSILRVPGIYAGNRLPIERLKAGTPALKHEEDVFTNHIHADDLARIIIYAFYRGSPQRVLNASDSSWLKMGEYFDLVAKNFGLPSPQRLTFEELRTQVSSQMLSFMKESRRLQNERLMELGFHFLYPTVEDFLQHQKEK